MTQLALGSKFDNDKVRLDLVPIKPLIDEAKVLTFGAKKYADRNWEAGIAWSRLYGATMRHITAWWNGEDLDPESGLPHLAHAKTDIAFLLEFLETHPELDDRPKRKQPTFTGVYITSSSEDSVYSRNPICRHHIIK